MNDTFVSFEPVKMITNPDRLQSANNPQSSSNDDKKPSSDGVSSQLVSKINSIDTYLFLVMGKSGSGKSQFIQSFTGKKLLDKLQHVKGGKDDFFSKMIRVPIEAKIEMIREFEQQKFTKNTSMNADCAIFLFDLTADFEETKADMERFSKIVDDRCQEHIIRVAVGTKIDLDDERKAPSIR